MLIVDCLTVHKGGSPLAKKLNPVVVNLIYDALLKCFWRKEALKRFLRTVGISGSYIAQLDNNETKRVWLDRLFPLVSEHENGTELLLTMGRSLATMTSFPDLQGWEDSAKKLEEAKAAVAGLATVLRADDDRVVAERSVK